MNTEVLPGTTAVALIASIDISDAAITLHSSNDMGTVTFTDRSDDTLHSTFSSLVSAPNCKKNVFLSREMNYASSLTMKGSTAHSAAYWSGIDVPPLEGTASFILNKKPLASTIAIATIDP
ncbi:hypothetical protein H6770_05780 [Candidatus Peribacteria bacterium]|nr:hypothetical protein [Candidatus Peribacteria bacterium]